VRVEPKGSAAAASGAGPRSYPHDVPFSMRIVRLLSASALGYVLGTIPSADVASRLATGGKVNLRDVGSRNPGGVNAGRVLGNAIGRAVVASDVAKGYAACAGGHLLAGDLGAHVAGTSAVLGHCYPAWTSFRGGKGLATSFGHCLYTFPVAAPVDLGVAIGVARIPGLLRPGLASTAAASIARLLMSAVWWRRKLPNSWGARPTAALVLANAVTVVIVASRFLAAHRSGHPDDLQAPL
jgi:glycerol-3-phosphate acyltransferase PlsY